jgi:uncharacterized protein YndB with AHSA1/START domain
MSESSISAPPGRFWSAWMQPLQIRRFSREGPNPMKRMTFPGGPKGVSQSLQRGSEGIFREIQRIQGAQQKCPRASPMSTSRHFSSCDFRAKPRE